MSESKKPPVEHSDHAPEAYDRILDRLRHTLDEASLSTWEALQDKIEEAVEIELAAEEMTRDEIDLLTAYVNRDLKHLGYFVHETGGGIAGFLRFDLNVLEQTILDRLVDLADRTRVEHELLREQLEHGEDQFVAGEITVPGTLRCLNCGHEKQLMRTKKILPCAQCGAYIFERLSGAGAEEADSQ